MALTFDATYYLQQNPDVAVAISRGQFTSAQQHYDLFGRFESRNPSAYFDTTFYLISNPDVAAARVNPFQHFLQFGAAEGRFATASADAALDTDNNNRANEFNETAYRAAYSDVDTAIKNGQFTSAYQHYVLFGQFEATRTVGVPAGGPFTNTNSGSILSLTAGVDNLVGTGGNDTFNAVNTSTSSVLGGLDKIDGGAGIDTFNITDTATAANADFSLPAGISITNIERMTVTTNGAIGTAGATAFDVSGVSGLTSFTGVAAGAGSASGSNVKAAGTTDVNLTVAGTNSATISGGKAVAVTAGTGAATVTGNALTSVTVTGSNGAAIDNTSTAGVSATGTTLTSVALAKVEGDSTIKGQGLTTISLTGATATAHTVTVTDAKANHAITVNVDGTGYKADGTAAQTVFVDAAAQSISVNATGSKSSLSLAGSSAATSVAITGSADLALLTSSLTSLTKIDGSASTGALSLGTLNAAAVNVLTGSGADSFTVAATAKVAVDAGAGNDIVTLGSTLAAGSTINLGAGDDVLLGTAPVAASTSSATTVIDGGAGIDSVSTGLLNAGNAAQFVNFEKLSIATNTSLDASLITKSSIIGVSIDGDASGTLSGLTSSQSLSVNANNSLNTGTTLTFSNVTGTSDAYDISFNAKTTGTTASPTAIAAGIVEIQGIENVSIHSNSASGVTSNSIILKDADARSLVIDGSQALNVSFNTAFGTTGTNTGVSTINGSAATGALTIDIANVKAAAGGLTVIGGSAADTLTTSTFASTLTGNAGNDVFKVGAAVVGSVSAPVITTITDFTKGDTIGFKDASGTTDFVTAKVDVSSATTLAQALDLAAATNVTADNAHVTWFQYGGNTYAVEDLSTSAALATTDVVVKLTGLVDLSTASVSSAEVLSLA